MSRLIPSTEVFSHHPGLRRKQETRHRVTEDPIPIHPREPDAGCVRPAHRRARGRAAAWVQTPHFPWMTLAARDFSQLRRAVHLTPVASYSVLRVSPSFIAEFLRAAVEGRTACADLRSLHARLQVLSRCPEPSPMTSACSSLGLGLVCFSTCSWQRLPPNIWTCICARRASPTHAWCFVQSSSSVNTLAAQLQLGLDMDLFTASVGEGSAILSTGQFLALEIKPLTPIAIRGSLDNVMLCETLQSLQEEPVTCDSIHGTDLEQPRSDRKWLVVPREPAPAVGLLPTWPLQAEAGGSQAPVPYT
ncbi:uncharacterized protein LOC104848865 [Fukomys damarensis]|uniref:uncharacterized protein LOC104848865 n=1 Tax=Fukomys damarensis TaxID=885580 RepID=UPI00053F5007|nr:uncharacterized protein LOC104848865 [Fukomys damarensis]